MGGIIKETKRNKCDLCDELAIFKTKEESEPYMYLCKSCYKENQKPIKKINSIH